MATLDLRPPSLTIKLDQGKTLNPIFYYLSSTYDIINLVGYTARMQVKVAYSDTVPVLDLDNLLKGGITLVTGTAIIDETTSVTGAHGIQLSITPTQTAALSTDITYIYDIELVDLSSVVLPFLKGTIVVSAEVTK